MTVSTVLQSGRELEAEGMMQPERCGRWSTRRIQRCCAACVFCVFCVFLLRGEQMATFIILNVIILNENTEEIVSGPAGVA